MSETLGHYKILDRVGTVGIGEVYRARDTRLGRTVAVTEVAAAITDDPSRRERFSQDARASLVLSHPNIAALYEVNDDQGQLYLVREFVPGHTLTIDMGGRPMNPRRAIDLATQIADALAAAHDNGIVSRGICPDNIIVTPKGNAKVVDFGLATWAAPAPGTAAYVSPEQALGQPVDPRSDLFSLGVVLFEMLTGRLPFKGQTADAAAAQIAVGPAPAATTINRSLPAELDAVLSKALARRPDERYASGAVLAAELRTIAAILDARSASSEPPVVAAVRPRRGVPIGRTLAVGVVAVLAAALWWQRAAVARVWRHALGPAPAPLIALVPFDTDPTQTFFADGFTEDLIARLGQTPGLKVLGRSAARGNRGRPPQDVARELGAAVVLTGSIRRSGDAVTVAGQLIDPRDGAPLWTGEYARDTAGIFAIQAQIASDVARALGVKQEPTASSERARSRVVDPRAYEAYLRGRQAESEGRLPDARRSYEQASQTDDGLAEAYSGLAEILALEPIAGFADDPSRGTRLARAAGRAYELAPDSPEANAAMALASDRLSDALTYLKKSVAIDASYSEGFHQIADQIADLDPDRAVAFYRHALVLDPRMTASRGDIVTTLAAAGRAAEANRELEAASSNPAAFSATPFRIGLALDEHQFDVALRLLTDGDWWRKSHAFGLLYANTLRAAGQADQARAVVGALMRQDRNDCEARATLAALDFEHGQAPEARQLVAEALRNARTSDVGPLGLRCAIHSAAAVGDAAFAAALLGRIAADERLRREWAMNILGITGSHLLRTALYPWSRIADQPPVAEGRRAIDRAYAQARQQAADALADLTPTIAAPRP